MFCTYAVAEEQLFPLSSCNYWLQSPPKNCYLPTFMTAWLVGFPPTLDWLLCLTVLPCLLYSNCRVKRILIWEIIVDILQVILTPVLFCCPAVLAHPPIKSLLVCQVSWCCLSSFPQNISRIWKLCPLVVLKCALRNVPWDSKAKIGCLFQPSCVAMRFVQHICCLIAYCWNASM